MTEPLHLTALLALGHNLGDWALQSDTVAQAKNGYKPHSLHQFVPWQYFMLGHAATHGAIVYMVTFSLPLAILETIFHFAIDTLKCSGRINIHHDQLMHYACKVIWVFLYFNLSWGLHDERRIRGEG